MAVRNRAIIKAEFKRLWRERPGVMNDLRERIAEMLTHAVQALLIEAKGSIREAT